MSYNEFRLGKMPQHVKKLACPMLTDQSACYCIKGFTAKCNDLNGGYFSFIPDCKNQLNKEDCWKRFEEHKNN